MPQEAGPNPTLMSPAAKSPRVAVTSISANRVPNFIRRNRHESMYVCNLGIICRESRRYLSVRRLCSANHQALPGRFHDFPSDAAQVVNLKDTPDLSKERWSKRKFPPVIRTMLARLHYLKNPCVRASSRIAPNDGRE